MHKSRESYDKLASLLNQRTPVTRALLEAGWAPTTAERGWDAVPKKVYIRLSRKIREEVNRLTKIGETFGPEQRKNLIRGKLIENVTNGVDRGSLSCKILGSDVEVNMWEKENQVGVVIITGPNSSEKKEPPVL